MAPESRDLLVALGSASAPIFVDEVTTFGSLDGVTNITLEADRPGERPHRCRDQPLPERHLPAVRSIAIAGH
jgi:hypothetical protein